MPKHVYCCAECGESRIGITSPDAKKCPEAPFHRWINVGLDGDIKFKCSHCSVSVSTTKLPASYGCRKNLFHEWSEVQDKKI